MKTYKIKVKQTFTGTVEVRAESKAEALKIMNIGFNFPTLDVHSKHSWSANEKEDEGILDWDFDDHSQENKIS